MRNSQLHGLSILDALDSPHLLSASIRNAESWKPWRAFLGAMFGLPLSDDEVTIYKACTARAAVPAEPFSFLWLVCGRRGGKSFAMAIVAVFMAVFKDWRKYLSPGERAVVLLVAADREQAKILLRYILGILSTPLLSGLIEARTADTIDLAGSVTIEVVTRSYRSVRGRSVCVALLDELAFWRDDSSANPDAEVFNAIRASMATFGSDAVVVAGSSPYAKSGLLWDSFKRWFGTDDSANLVWKAPTRVMNPTVPQAFIDREIERDPASASSEFGAEFRNDIAAFVALAVVESCVANGVYEIAPLSAARYFAFVDPSGGSADSMTMGITPVDLDALEDDHATGQAAVDMVARELQVAAGLSDRDFSPLVQSHER